MGIVQLPYISNHTDLEIFQYEDDVSVRRIMPGDDFSRYDGIVIPGTKSTIGDLNFLENNGVAEKLKAYRGHLFGICGGYQMLGESLCDDNGVDGAAGCQKPGLGLLPVQTRFVTGKTVSQVEAVGIHPLLRTIAAKGYEIHLGRTEGGAPGYGPLWRSGGKEEGMASLDFRVGGSYLHNIFHNDGFRSFWLNLLRREKGLPEKAPLDTVSHKERQYERLAAAARKHLDIDYILELIAGSGKR